jgi:hypothetical protein
MICDECGSELLNLAEFFLALCGDSEHLRSLIRDVKTEDAALWNSTEGTRTFAEWLRLFTMGFRMNYPGKPMPMVLQIACMSESMPPSTWVN